MAYAEVVVDFRGGHLTIGCEEFHDVPPCGISDCTEQLLAHGASLVSSMDKLLTDYLIKPALNKL